jgi:serine/threonine protein kinase
MGEHAMTDLTGQVFGSYELQALIGAGGMSQVYRGLDRTTGQTVAVKALKPALLSAHSTHLERFMREGELLRALDHPNIVKLLEVFEDHGQQFLVMEYVPGGSLRDVLTATPQLPLERVLWIALDLADALTRAHRLDIIHRDLKPENVLIAGDGTPRLTDFGIAQLVTQARLTGEGHLVGTPH